MTLKDRKVYSKLVTDKFSIHILYLRAQDVTFFGFCGAAILPLL